MSIKALLISFSTLLLATTIFAIPSDCPGICIALFDPVCAKDNTGKLKTFSNSCRLSAANRCKEPGSPFKFVSKGECPKNCPGICPRIFKPVCAKDVKGNLKTFGNQCELDAANRCKKRGSPFKFLSKGECPKKCPGICPLNFDPVCAKDVKGNLKTFGNQCQLDDANRCKVRGSPFKFVSKGRCRKVCAVPCPKIFRPVCGLSLRTKRRRTFANKCLLEAENKCKKPGSPWKVLHKGACKTCAQCPAILCRLGEKCVTKDGCGKCVKLPTAPSCCATILCTADSRCVQTSTRPPRCECRPIVVRKYAL